MSRVAFAADAGIDSSQLARYELLRAPLKCADALKISKAHGIGLPWLAVGGDDAVRSPWQEDANTPAEGWPVLFSEAFPVIFSTVLKKQREEAGAWGAGFIETLKEISLLIKAGSIPEADLQLMQTTVERIAASIAENQAKGERLARVKPTEL